MKTSVSVVWLSPHLTRSIISHFHWTHLFRSRSKFHQLLVPDQKLLVSTFDKNPSSDKLVAGDQKAKEIRFKWNIPSLVCHLVCEKKRNLIRQKNLISHSCCLIIFFRVSSIGASNRTDCFLLLPLKFDANFTAVLLYKKGFQCV